MSIVRNGPCAVLLRHGETEWSRDGRHTGRSDIPLTELGRRQARATATALSGWSFAAVLCSPLERARETCRLAGLEGPRVRLETDLREWDYGAYEGLSTPEVRARRPGWLLWRDGVQDGEAVESVGLRADRVIATVRAAGGDVAIVGHGHLLRILTARWLGLPADQGGRFVLSPATLSVLGSEWETPALLRWNDGAHLSSLDAALTSG